MSRTKLFMNTGAYMVATLAPFAVNFIMLPIYTRFMTPADYGLLAVVNVLSAVLGSFSGLQMSTSIGRFYFDHDRAGQRVFFSSVLVSVCLINLLFVIPLYLLGDTVTAVLFPRADIPFDPFVILVLAGILITGVTHCCSGMLRTQERGASVLIIALITVVLGVAIKVYFVVIRKMGAHGALLGTILTGICFALMLFWANRRNLTTRLSWTMIKDALRFGLPAVPQSLGSILFIYTDKYILSFFSGMGSIGLYDIGDRVSSVMKVSGDSFKEAYSPTFMKLAVDDPDGAPATFKPVITRCVVILTLLYLGLAFYAEEAILLLLPPQYAGAYIFIPILVGAYFLKTLSSFPLNSIRYKCKTKVLPVGTIIAGVFNVVMNILLIPRFGVIVAAWTTLGSFAVEALLLLYFGQRFYALEIEWKKIGQTVGIGAVIFAAVFLARGDSMALNVVWKTLGVGAYMFIMARWIHPAIFGEIMMIYRLALRRLGLGGADSG